MPPSPDLTPLECFKMEFVHDGKRHQILVSSELDAALVRTLLNLKGAVDGGQQDGGTFGILQSHDLLPVTRAELAGIEFSQLVQRLRLCALNAACPSEVFANSAGRTLMHGAAFLGDALITELLLAVAPVLATRTDNGGRTPIYQAACGGQAATLLLLLAAAPSAAMPHTGSTRTPLHGAAIKGQTGIAQLLLTIAPAMAAMLDAAERPPLHMAAISGSLEIIQLLLRASPQQAWAIDYGGAAPVHLAARHARAAAVQLLLVAAPETARVTNNYGRTPLHMAAMGAATMGSATAAVEVLLTAAGDMAMARDSSGDLPLHHSASNGNAGVTRQLLAAAPQAADVRNANGQLPLHMALGFAGDWWEEEDAAAILIEEQQSLDKARCLVGYGPAADVLAALQEAGDFAQPLFADFVITRLPLSASVWALLPTPCPGLGRALPAALAHSEQQACSLVRHLPPAAAHALRTAALCLGRVHLPQQLVWQVLVLAVA